jgi:hypothetical protein
VPEVRVVPEPVPAGYCGEVRVEDSLRKITIEEVDKAETILKGA